MVTEKKHCVKCKGEGRVFWQKLDDYDGPGSFGGAPDYTEYTCDWCEGSGEAEPECELCGTDLEDTLHASFDHEKFHLCVTCVRQIRAVVASAKPIPSHSIASVPVIPLGLPFTAIGRDNIQGLTRVQIKGGEWLNIRDSDLLRCRDLYEAISEHMSGS